MSDDTKHSQNDLLHAAANYWYERDYHSENGRWQECFDYAKKCLSEYTAQAVERARLDEVDMARSKLLGSVHNQALKLREHLGDRYTSLTANQKERTE